MRLAVRLARLLLVCALPLAAAAPAATAAAPRKPAAAAAPALDLAALFGTPREAAVKGRGMAYRNIGPSRGGRVTAVTGVTGQPRLFYMGATGGGVFRTTDGGGSWEPLSDRDFRTGSVGAIAVAPSDPNVLYAGMGEAPIRGNVSHGDGVYKSTDAGRSWRNVGLGETRHIARIHVHPQDPDLVYVAAQGHAFGPNPERGIYRSRDGGKSWTRVLFVDEKTGASDLAMDATNPRVLFAGFWQVVRRPWSLESGGASGGLHRSTDGGDTWTRLTEGLPEGLVGKVGVTVSPARPERVWAIVEAEKGGVFRSDDRGDTWQKVNAENDLRQRAWYYSRIQADTRSADTVYVLNVELWRSIDGGKTFTEIDRPHGDNHDIWIAPEDPQWLIVGNDGGATVSYDGGRTWSSQATQATAQFYRVTVDDRTPYWVYGAQQDNSTVAIASASMAGGQISRSDWYPVGGGESGWIAPKPNDPEVVYAGSYGGEITRYDHRTRQERNILAWPQLAVGQAAKDLRYRFQWNAPIVVSRHDPKTLYHGAQMLLRSRDEGETWQEVSPDLTRNDKAKQESSGGPITKDNTGVEVYGTIFALAESPHDARTLWAGTDDGRVHVTRDGGATWQDVTPKGLPEWIQINSIDVSTHDPNAVYLAATMYKHDDFRPFLYRTADGGKSWTKIVGGLPETAFTRVVREDPVRRGLLYAGTETGIHVSFDDGGSWKPFQLNLPVVPITDMVVKDDDLVLATQGRAFWILDDLGPLRDWKDELAAAPAHLFRPRPAHRGARGGDGPDGRRPVVGDNPANGVVVDFWLKEAPGDEETATLEVLEGEKVLRTFRKLKKSEKEAKEKAREKGAKEDEDEEKPLELKPGLNRFVWDLRMLKPELLPKAVIWGSKDGPRVAPGTYRVRLTAAGKTLTETAEVRPHPALSVSPAALARQAKLLADIRDRLEETHRTVRQIRDVKEQVEKLGERAGKLTKGEALKAPAKALTDRLTAIEERLVNPKMKSPQDVLNFTPRLDHQFVGLASVVGSAEAAPAPASLAYYDELTRELGAIKAELAGVYQKELAELARAVREQDLPPVLVVPLS